MMNYAEYMNAVIQRGQYALEDMENRIDRLWMDGRLTDEERGALMASAADNADNAYQVDVLTRLAELERRVWELEHPVEQYVVWEPGYQTKQHEIVRYDVTGDGEYDLCQYNGGRSYTALSIGKIEGWVLLDAELNPTHTITKADGAFVLTAMEAEDGAV